MPSDLKTRTGDFALRIITLYSALPTRGAGYVLGLQVLKSGTSVGAHNREACRAKSNADFVSEIEGALQELDETAYWLELIGKALTWSVGWNRYSARQNNSPQYLSQS